MGFRDGALIGIFAAGSWLLWSGHLKTYLADMPDDWAEQAVGQAYTHADKFYREIGFVVFVIAFLINMVIGKRKNKNLAIRWTHQLITPGSAIERNFSMVGPDMEAGNNGQVLMKDTSAIYTVHASGRRNCNGMLLQFRLKPRQDLMGMLLTSIWSSNDALEVQVSMNEGTVAPMTLFIGTPSALKENQEAHRDLTAPFVKRVDVAKSRLPVWPTERLTVVSEQASTFYDLMTQPQVMDLAFSADAFAEIKSYFRFLHIASEFQEGGPKGTIRMGMYLPALTNPEVVNRVLTLVTTMIDVVAGYKPTSEQLAKAKQLRAKEITSVKGNKGEEVRRRAEERRAAKEAEEKARLARMNPAQREKEKAKKERIARERRMRSMVKMK